MLNMVFEIRVSLNVYFKMLAGSFVHVLVLELTSLSLEFILRKQSSPDQAFY